MVGNEHTQSIYKLGALVTNINGLKLTQNPKYSL